MVQPKQLGSPGIWLPCFKQLSNLRSGTADKTSEAEVGNGEKERVMKGRDNEEFLKSAVTSLAYFSVHFMADCGQQCNRSGNSLRWDLIMRIYDVKLELTLVTVNASFPST